MPTDLTPQFRQRRVYRGAIYNTLGPEQYEFFPDGGLAVGADGRIEACGFWTDVQARMSPEASELVELPATHLLMPGLMDLHVHLPQLDATGRQADDLLSWLERHIFLAEAEFADSSHAEAVSRRFFRELLKNGTTTAAVFLTSHAEATEIAFRAAETAGNRVIMGQNLMDVNGPPALTRPTKALLRETETLCKRWHGVDEGRIQYAWMPRFALTSSEALLAGIGELRRKYPDVYLHTHLSEQPGEIEAVARQFPWSESYTHVYDRFGLLGPRSILAHGIHLSDSEISRLHECACGIAHCPGSNFFLKSGRFRWFDVLAANLRVGLGSDVGAGPELSILKAMKDAQYMQNERFINLHTLFYTATLGAARALHQEDRLGNFAEGKEADFIIVDRQAKSGAPVEKLSATNLEDALSTLVYLGDDRLIAKTFVRGGEVYAWPDKFTPVSARCIL